MKSTQSMLPREVPALVHHIELNRAGWWEKTLNRLILAVVWLSSENLTEEQIYNAMKETFGLTVNKERLKLVIEQLKSEDSLVEIANGVFRIPEKARSEFDREVAEAEEAENNARNLFLSLAAEYCPKLVALDVWKAFEGNFLLPMVRDIGANTYRLIIGEVQKIDGAYSNKFLAAFGSEYRTSLKSIVAKFLDPSSKDVREYVTRMLHAHFCVESSGVSEEVLDKIKRITAKPVIFNLFVDTNFLFSMLSLHENPSNPSASELKDLLSTLKSNPKVDLYITPRTICEAKSAIGTAKIQVSGVPSSRNFTEAALRTGLSGMSEKFFSERKRRNGHLTVDDWFEPYLKDFVPLARTAGVELFNESLDSYATRQDVVDDILRVMEYEKKILPEERRKSYGNVAHDIILWHFVKDKRQAYVESPIEAQEWILTVDFRLIGFDQHKLNYEGSNVPLCLHPTSLIQLLQFWVPRTQQFEQAVLGGLRLPFLFQEFDANAERLSLNIIRRLGRFEGSEEVSEESLIKVITNDGLRSRIDKGQPEEEEIKMVRDALVEEMRLQAEAEKAKVEELKAIVQEKSDALLESSKTHEEKDNEIRKLKKRLNEAEKQSQATLEALSKVADKHSNLESRLAQIEEDKLNHKTLSIYIILLIVVVALSVFVGWLAGCFLSVLNVIIGTVAVQILSGVFVFIAAHMLLEWFGSKYNRLNRLWLFRQVSRFRKRLWIILILGFILGVMSNLYANRIQANIDKKEKLEKTTTPLDEPNMQENISKEK